MGRKTNLETSSFSDIRDTFLVLPEMLNSRLQSILCYILITVYFLHLRLSVNLRYSVFVDSEADFCSALAMLFCCEAREVDLNYLTTVVLNL